MRQKRTCIERIRCLVFVKRLCRDLDLELLDIHAATTQCYYEAIGFRALSEEAVLAYSWGRRTPEIDPPWPGVLSWTMAVEFLFSGQTDILFHPLWNLLDGPLVSRRGALPAGSSRARPRARRTTTQSPVLNDLYRIRACMLQLPREIWIEMFSRPSLPDDYRRVLRPVDAETRGLQQIAIADQVAMGIAMVLEAIELGDTARLNSARAFLSKVLPRLLEDSDFSEVAAELEQVIKEKCFTQLAAGQNIFQAVLAGYPGSWQPHAIGLALNKYFGCLGSHLCEPLARGAEPWLPTGSPYLDSLLMNFQSIGGLDCATLA